MHQRPGSSDRRYDIGTQRKGRRLDLSIPQVAGSALAAIAAAVLASQLGVYGTVVGAGVVSVIATCGGSFFQHLFRRTGERLMDVTEQVRPKVRQVPGRREERSAPAHPSGAAATGAFGAATVYGTRLRGWKRPLGMAVVAFLVAMLCITGYELAAGRDLSGGHGTTVGSVVGGSGGRPGHGGGGPVGTPSPGSSPTDTRGPSGGGRPTPSDTSGTGATPGRTPGGGTGTAPGQGSGGSTSPRPPDGGASNTPGGPSPSAPSPAPTGGTGGPGDAGLRGSTAGSGE